MSQYIIGAIVGISLLLGTFYTGRWYERNLQAKVTVKQLQTDAVAVDKIEKNDEGRKAKIVTQVKVIHEKAPEWSVTCLPEPVLSELRNSGIRTQPDSACRH